MKRFLTFLAISLFGLGLVQVVSVQPARAVDLFGKCNEADCKIVKEDRLSNNNSNMIWGIIRVVITILGAVSVIMLIVGGFRFTLSNGDQNAVKSAKNTVLYAVIGLVIAMLAGSIVLFVTGVFL